jgi:hypothetical protein
VVGSAAAAAVPGTADTGCPNTNGGTETPADAAGGDMLSLLSLLSLLSPGDCPNANGVVVSGIPSPKEYDGGIPTDSGGVETNVPDVASAASAHG